ncbi:hypothetical protein [Niallia taxi]|uniref:Uncharacterized protein n=1 Tax=Niallia taxi TaxID=2499688 RepID=A0A437KH76_9BACI|nr:hypothetical protein [Niallia taxi]RVT67666.1 hypothetical protein EM808_04105 [Niallia taxi]
MAKLSKKKQDVLIDEEKKRLLDIFKDIPDSKIKVAMNLIERVAFMKVTLEILEDDIKTRGPTYLFQNGSQKMKVENPSQKSYNTMINRFTTAHEKLLNLLPKENGEIVYVTSEVTEEVDDFEKF